MSQENVESGASPLDAFSTGDFARALEQAEPDFEWFRPIGTSKDRLKDETSFSASSGTQEEAYEEFRIEAEELTDHGDQVVAFIRIRGRGRSSGVEFDIRAATVWTFDEGTARTGQGLPEPGRSPRSRRAVGVGDVAGERRRSRLTRLPDGSC